MQTCTRIYYSNVLLIAQHVSSDTTHHQELQNCNCNLWFYICLWLPAAVSGRQPQTYVKPETAITILELLMMSGVSLETC